MRLEESIDADVLLSQQRAHVLARFMPDAGHAWEDILGGRHLMFIQAYLAYLALLAANGL